MSLDWPQLIAHFFMGFAIGGVACIVMLAFILPKRW